MNARRIGIVMAAVVAALALSTQALAKSPLCAPPTSGTGTTGMNSHRILKAVGGNYGGPLGLTADQRRAIQSALSGYNSLGYALDNGGTVAISRHTFDGFGLTDAQQTAIWRYISENVKRSAPRTRHSAGRSRTRSWCKSGSASS